MPYKNKKEMAEYHKRRYIKNKEESLKRHRQYYLGIREKVLAFYSHGEPRYGCCGEKTMEFYVWIILKEGAQNTDKKMGGVYLFLDN